MTAAKRKPHCSGKVPFIYIDNASTTFPKPDMVYKYMNDFYRQYGVNPGRSKGTAYQQAEKVLTETRKRLTRLFGAKDYKRTVFTYNVTDSLNMIINGTIENGDHVITTMLEHNAVIRPLNHLGLTMRVKVDWIKFDKEGYIDPGDIKKRIRKNTKLVIVNHGSNVLGTVQPIKEIGEICRRAGVIFAIDAAQTAGVVPIDMEKSRIDIVAFTGHKSLLGPMGIGGMHVRDGVKIKAVRSGGTGILSREKYQPEIFPYYLECGTVNMVGVAGLFAAYDYLIKRGIRNIYQHEIKLARALWNGLRQIDRVVLYSEPVAGKSTGIVSFGIKGISVKKIGGLLESRYGICSRAGLHCAPLVHESIGTVPEGMVRLSIGPFNTAVHVEKAVAAVREIVKSTFI